ncbi:MAG: glycosyltransferase family 2 protein [Phycisphaeraceae bacterium]|nr:glycosyltransferase family 2 protein [Phycisphaeraceae bacterium]
MRLAVVMPVYNEEATLAEAVARLDAVPAPATPGGSGSLERRLILVDDGSTDGTPRIVRLLGERPDVLTVIHKRNMGKGAALRSGFAAALADGADVVLIHDADLEYDPADHAPLLRPILDGRADAVIGTRFLGQTHRVLYYWHSVANRVITTLSNMLTNLNLTDVECCLKAFRRETLEGIRVEEDRFGVEPELVAKLSRLRLPREDRMGETRPARIYEVPVSYAGRTYAEGKKITWRDGVAAAWCILKYGLK